MDERFPKWLRTVLQKLDFLGIPNLGPLVCGMAVLAFIAQHSGTIPYERFVFNPYLVLEGEWWRLFTFPVSQALSNPLWLLMYVLYLYFVVNTLESHWGPGPTTVYLILGYVSALAGAFITMRPIEIWYYILENVSLAFGTLFPNFELMLYFVLPVKAKWLAMLAGALILLKFIAGGMATKILLLCALFPYLLFFGPFLFKELQMKRKAAAHRKRFDKDMWR